MTPMVERLGGPFGLVRLTRGNTVVEAAPERGGLVTRFCVGGDEVLFLDDATFRDATKNVRGGVPILFPYAGKPPPTSTLPQHGFARKSVWTLDTSTPECLSMVLEDSDDTKRTFPFAFRLETRVSVPTEGRLKLEWRLENRSTAPMPFHFGLHPYFRVGDKAKVSVDGVQGRAFDNRTGRDVDVSRVDFSADEVDLHFSPFTRGGTTLQRGDGSALTFEWSDAFDTLVLWTLPGQPFVCIEPWTARGQHEATRFVEPSATHAVQLELTIRARAEVSSAEPSVTAGLPSHT